LDAISIACEAAECWNVGGLEERSAFLEATALIVIVTVVLVAAWLLLTRRW